MNGGTISGNIATGIGGGARVVSGVFTMNGGTIRNNTAVQGGGGVRLAGEHEFIMNGGRIINNTASGHGGGVYFQPWGSNNKFTMNSGTISYNTAGGGGGGVCIGSGILFTMNGGFGMNTSIISHNKAFMGGGVLLLRGRFLMNGGLIRNNTATFVGDNVYGSSVNDDTADGGGVCVIEGGEFIMNDGTISDNSADNRGGGVSVGDGGEFTMNHGIIADNTAGDHGGGVFVWGDNSNFTIFDGYIYNNIAPTGDNIDGDFVNPNDIQIGITPPDVPITGIQSVAGMFMAMLAFLMASIMLWAYALRRKQAKVL
jgi:hypothetical protein